MYTQCPQCLTYFQVTPDHLKVAQGNVRCGQCRNVFNALGNLTELPPEAVAAENAGNQSSKTYFEENMSASMDDFEKDLDTGKAQNNTTTKRQGLSAAIDKINKLNKKSGIQSLAEGRRSFIEKLKRDTGGRKDTSPRQPSKTEVPKPVSGEYKPAKSAKMAKPAAKPAVQNAAARAKAAAAAATAAAGKVKQKPSAPQQAVRPAAVKKAKPTTPKANEAKRATTPNTTTKQTAAAKKKSPVRGQRHIKPKTQEVAIKPGHEDIDVDKALSAIDELDITADPGRITQMDQSAFDAIEEIVLSDHAEELIDNEAPVDIKIKPLNRPNSTEKGLVPVPSDDMIPTVTDIPKALLEDYHRAQAAAVEHNRQLRKMPLWIIGSIVLMVVFLGQAVYFRHDDLARYRALKPWMETFCEKVNCEINLPFEQKRFELLGQDIRSHPKIQKALRVSVTIINRAKFTQAYPGLQITFTDMNDQKVAMRRFVPNEYLKNHSEIDNGMPSDTPVQVELELIDPGSQAVNFEFDFFRAS